MTHRPPDGSLIPIARITRTQGRHGAFRVRIEFDDPRLFETGRRVDLVRADERMETAIEELRFQHGRQVLKLEGIDSIGDAEGWVGGVVSIGAEELPEPGEGTYFDFDLAGCEVHTGEGPIGVVTEVVDYGGTALLRIERDGRETLIPFAHRFLKKIDTGKQRIDVELPEGLLDLNP